MGIRSVPLTVRGTARWALALLLAAAVAAVAFAFRFNTLGGTLGGFDDDEFAHLMRTDAVVRGEQPLRDFADPYLRGAWPALTYAVPAWAQAVWGHNLLAEAYLTAGALALAHALTFLLALDLSRWRWSVAVPAAILVVVTAPKLYNYPKVLVLMGGALAIRLVAASLSPFALAFAALVTAGAILFRHDYGVYLGLGIVAGLVAREFWQWRALAARLAMYAGITAVVLLPSAVWVQRHRGLAAYLADSLRSSQIEARRTSLTSATVDALALPSESNLIVATYYAFVWVPILALAVVAIRMRGSQRLTPEDRSVAIGLAALAAAATVFMLRANLTQRFGDVAIPVVLLIAWMAGQASFVAWRPARVGAGVAARALLVALVICAFGYAATAGDLRSSGLSTSWGAVHDRFHELRDGLERLPPDHWPAGDVGRVEAERYLAACTAPDDRVLLAVHAPEIPVFARRLFAGGDMLSLGFGTLEPEQRQFLERLRAQSVPVMLASEDMEDAFVTDYPLLAAYAATHYREAGTIRRTDSAKFRVFVEVDRRIVRQDPLSGLPCYR